MIKGAFSSIKGFFQGKNGKKTNRGLFKAHTVFKLFRAHMVNRGLFQGTNGNEPNYSRPHGGVFSAAPTLDLSLV